MAELADTRIIETDSGWIVQFRGGFGWTQLGDEYFSTQAQAQEFLEDQIDTSDPDPQ